MQCWFSVPVLIYLAAIPAFQRTKRFANPYAFAVLDVLFTILWFAAFIAVAVYTNTSISNGEAKDKDHKRKGCAAFDGGSESKCKLSQATIGMGVVILYTLHLFFTPTQCAKRLTPPFQSSLLFLATSAISVYGLIYYRKNGSLPGATHAAEPVPIEDQTKYAFSSNPHDDFDEEEALGPRSDRQDDDYELLHGDRAYAPSPLGGAAGGDDDTAYHGGQTRYDHPDQLHPVQDPFRGRTPSPMGYGSSDTSYHGAAGGAGASGGAYARPPAELQGAAGDPFRDDLALSHDHGGYAAGGRSRVDFPEADYQR